MTTKKTKDLSYGMRLVLWALSDKPNCVKDVAKMTGICKASVNDQINLLRDRGLVFQSGSYRSGTKEAALWSVHVPHPKPEQIPGGHRVGAPSKRLQSILDAIADHPMTVAEIADITGATVQNVNSCLTYTRNGGRDSSVVRVAEWVYRDGRGGGWVAVYGPGPGADVKQPATQDRRKYLRRWRELNMARHRAREAARHKSSVMAGNPFAQLIQVAGATRHASRALEVV